MFLEVGGECGENRVRTVLVILGLGQGRADAPDRLSNAPRCLDSPVHGAVVYVSGRLLHLGQHFLSALPLSRGCFVALYDGPEPLKLTQVFLGGPRIVECGGTLLDRGLALHPGEQLQGVDGLAGMLKEVVHKIHAGSVNERSRRTVVGKRPGTLALLQGVATLIRAKRREQCNRPRTRLPVRKAVPPENARNRG
jgi:hypothetical protein